MAKKTTKIQTSFDIDEQIAKTEQEIEEMNARRELLLQQKEQVITQEKATFFDIVFAHANKEPSFAQTLIELVEKSSNEKKKIVAGFTDQLRAKTNSPVEPVLDGNSKVQNQAETKELSPQELEEIELEKMLQEEELAKNNSPTLHQDISPSHQVDVQNPSH